MGNVEDLSVSVLRSVDDPGIPVADIVQKADTAVDFHEMVTMTGHYYPVSLHGLLEAVEQEREDLNTVLLHRDEEGYCVPNMVQNGFSATYWYDDKSISCHRDCFSAAFLTMGPLLQPCHGASGLTGQAVRSGPTVSLHALMKTAC